METVDVRHALESALLNDLALLRQLAQRFPQALVSRRRATLAGCCAKGVKYFSYVCFEGRSEGTLSELLTPPYNPSYVVEREYARRRHYIATVASYVIATALLKQNAEVVRQLRKLPEGTSWRKALDETTTGLRKLVDNAGTTTP